MRKSFFLLLFLYLAIPAAFAQNNNKNKASSNTNNKAGKADTEEAVLQVEQQRFDLLVKKDMEGLKDILADDLLYTHSNGITETKEQYLQGLASGKSVYYAIKPEETKVRLYGNTAIINGIANIDTDINGQKGTLRLKYTDAYVKRNGKWQLVAWQSLRMQQ